MSRTSVTQAIADAVHEVDEWAHPTADDIRTVEFRRGLAEITVNYRHDSGWDDRGDDIAIVTIPAEDVLSALLQWAVESEQAAEVVSRHKASEG